MQQWEYATMEAPHSLWIIAVAIALLGSATVLGVWILDRLAFQDATRMERIVFGAGIGLGLYGAAAFTLGQMSLLSAWTMRTTVALLIIGSGAILLRRYIGSRVTPPAGPNPTPGILAQRLRARPLNSPSFLHPHGASTPQIENRVFPSWTQALLAIGFLVLLCASFSCLSPMIDYDGLSYHIAAPKRWLEIGGMRSLPTHLHTEWPMGFEMLFLLQLPVSGPDGGKILVAGLAWLTVPAVFLLGRRLASAQVGAAAAALTLVAAGPDKINTTSIEIPLAFFVTLSALALTIWQAARPSARTRWLVLAAVCAGLANCTKLNGLLATAILAIAVFAASACQPRSWLSRVGDALLFGAIAVVTASPWYLRAWRDTGNPIFPFGWPLLGGRHWTAEAAHTLMLYFRLFNLPGETLAARQPVLIRHVVRLVLIAAVGVALPSPPRLRAIAACAALFALLQTLSSDQPRFFLPVLPFGALLAAWWIVWLGERWSGWGWLVAAAAGLYALPEAARAAWNDVPVITGIRPRAAYIRHYVNVAPACLWANGVLPPNARVLFGLDTRTYFLERDAYWSNSIVQRNIPFDTSEALFAALRAERIEYLIYNRGLLHVESVQFEIRNLRRDREAAGLDAIATRSALLWQENEVSVYRLPRASGKSGQGGNPAIDTGPPHPSGKVVGHIHSMPDVHHGHFPTTWRAFR
jgi:hypothetical protein